MKMFILLHLFVLLSNVSFANHSLNVFEKNYTELIKILKGALEVGECSISISDEGVEESSGTVTLNVLRSSGMFSVILNSPKSTKGASQVSNNPDNAQIVYSVSDVLGWVNILVDYNLKKEVTGLKVYKSLPSHTDKIYEGEIYNIGVACGIEANNQ